MILPFDTNIFPHKSGVFIVGGSIRDLMSNRTPFDYDVVVQHDAGSFANRLASKTSGRLVELGKQGQVMRRVITKDLVFDIMPLNGATIGEDLLQRDFTVNAMAVAVSSGSLIDHVGGRQDLASNKIRMVSKDVFRKDPVRLIRAYRLATAFGFSIDADTHMILAQDAHLIIGSAGERVREEFFKFIQSIGSHRYLAGMAHSGLLFYVFPELLALKNYRPEGAHPRNLFGQTMDAYQGLEKLLDAGGQLKNVTDDRLLRDIDAVRATLLKWAILFHDIGIPWTQTSTDEKLNHFSSHASKSAAMAEKICRRLKFSRRQTDLIGLIISNHLQPFFLFRRQQRKIPHQKAFARFFLMDGTGRQKDVNSRRFAVPQGLPGAVDVFIVAVRQAADNRAADVFGHFAHGLKVARRGDRKTGFDDIDAQVDESLGDFHLLRQVHTRSRRLLAVAERSVKDSNISLAHDSIAYERSLLERSYESRSAVQGRPEVGLGNNNRALPSSSTRSLRSK